MPMILAAQTVEPFGVRLKRLRKVAGLRQNVLAEYAGMSQPYISLLERGERDPLMIQVGMVLRLCQVLGLSVEDLLSGNDQPAALE